MYLIENPKTNYEVEQVSRERLELPLNFDKMINLFDEKCVQY